MVLGGKQPAYLIDVGRSIVRYSRLGEHNWSVMLSLGVQHPCLCGLAEYLGNNDDNYNNPV